MIEEQIKKHQEKIQQLNHLLDQARKRYDWNAYENIFQEKTILAVELRQLQNNLAQTKPK
jgi:multidrug resistance efflux pump